MIVSVLGARRCYLNSHVLDDEHADDDASNTLGCVPISTTATDSIVEIRKLGLKYPLFEVCRNMVRFSSTRRGLWRRIISKSGRSELLVYYSYSTPSRALT